ncbi:hypothetical protein AB5J56_23645 [Streptomyces sp. R21]|uniref:Uncharacterized protein n=1 Tax=Streptomyces sp. R21 TaxID=3238627 RepID=A0AB39P9T8_9ACTN
MRRLEDPRRLGEPAGKPPGEPAQPESQESDAERRRRRAQFLRELTEARELRDRVQPRRAKAARLRHAMRMRTFRW